MLTDSPSEVSSEDEEVLQTCLSKVIASVMGNRDSWPFREPVDPSVVPMYHQVIEEPIDLSVIRQKVSEGSYRNLRQVEQDFKLMVNNCETFNGPKNGYTSMVYAVWRAFRRAVHRYLDRDLDEDEQTVFLYPPKPKEQQPPSAAIEARRRKSAARHRKRMKALDVLERAAKIAVRDTQTGRSVSTLQQVSLEEKPPPSETDFIIFDELNKNKVSRVSGPLTGEALMKYLYNASNDASLTAFYVDTNDNLTFKSLTEWSDSIKNSGHQIILPQDAVLISPTASISGMISMKHESPDFEEKVRTLQVYNMNDPPDHIISSDKTAITASASPADSPPDNPVRKNSRTLVIKLSRCSDSGKMWRPVHFVSDSSQSN